jgi:L-alanine-DL-glutamate epimerase-like enolase superfamily enzyme
LLVDAGGAWDARTALARAESFRDLNLDWLEQPVRGNDPDALGWLRDRSPVPVAGGRHAAGREGFKPLLDQKALDIYQVDVTRCGFTDAAFLRARVEEAGAGIINSPGISAIAVAAGLHWLATCPDASLFADFAEDSLLRNDLTRERLQPEDGALTVPDTPGLGLSLNEDFVRQYLVAESGA